MAIIDIDKMYWEMKNTMQSNFQGTTEEKYNQAKELFLETIEGYIEENKEDLIKEVEDGN